MTRDAKPPFKFSARTRVGFSDTDAQGVVYYGRYNPYFDLARAEWLRSLGLLHRRSADAECCRAVHLAFTLVHPVRSPTLRTVPAGWRRCEAPKATAQGGQT